VGEKPIYLTKHAVQRGLRHNIDPQDFEKIIREGEKRREGRTKTRYILRTKSGTLIAICEELPDQIIIKTVTKGR